jgi:hypothetical protein
MESGTMESPQPRPAVISLRRSPQLTAALTRFDVFLDGKKVGRIANNERQQYEVSPGDHTLYVSIDDFASKRLTISLRPGENIHLTCWVKAFGLGVVLGFE